MTLLKDKLENKSLDLAFESIYSCFGYIDHISDKIHKLTVLYNTGITDTANNSFLQIIESMDLYIQLITNIYQVLRSELKVVNFKDENIQKLEIHLLSIMRAILQAKEKEDVVMLCDLLEYELIDNLVQWKIKVLPELKKLKSF